MTWWSRNTVTPTPNALAKSLPKIILDPEPDLSTKPKDIVGYCFGYVCPKKHVGSTFENITIDGYKERRACQTCGAVAKPAVVKRTAEARWEASRGIFSWWQNYRAPAGRYSPASLFTQYTRYEFVHYLDTPTRRKKK